VVVVEARPNPSGQGSGEIPFHNLHRNKCDKYSGNKEEMANIVDHKIQLLEVEVED